MASLEQLALHGGSPVRSTLFPARGHIGEEERAAVLALLDQAVASGVAPGYNGEAETAYCEAFAAFMGGGYVDAVSSGTAGLYVALKALALEPFSEVIVGAVTDPGGMMPIPLLNLIPMVADTAPDGYNTGPDQVAALLSPRTRALVVPHIAGEPADMVGLMRVARVHDLAVIEDCSQSHGAELKGQPVGTFGNIAVFSTMHGKHHSTGGQGGLVYTRDEGVYQTLRRVSDRGKPFFLPPEATNQVASLNFNSSDLAAAIGCAQLKKLPSVIARRRAIVAQIVAGLADLDVVSVPPPLEGAKPSYWFLRMRFHPEWVTCDKPTFCQALSAEGLPVAVDYRAALPHTQDWFVQRRVFGRSGYPWTSPEYKGNPDLHFPCPNAHAAMLRHFNVYFHENWTDSDVRDAVAIFHKVASAYAC